MNKSAYHDNLFVGNILNTKNSKVRRHVSSSPRYRPNALVQFPYMGPSLWSQIDPDEPSDDEWNDAAHRLMSDVLAEEFDEPAPAYGHADLHREWAMARHCRLDEDTDY